jgi:hypothetical protein
MGNLVISFAPGDPATSILMLPTRTLYVVMALGFATMTVGSQFNAHQLLATEFQLLSTRTLERQSSKGAKAHHMVQHAQ